MNKKLLIGVLTFIAGGVAVKIANSIVKRRKEMMNENELQD